MKNRLTVFLVVIFLSGFSLAIAQDGEYQVDTAASSMSILGTSTMHDWESVVEEYAATATLKGQGLVDVDLTCVVKSIKSGKASMDNNTYNAMGADQFPEITFTADQLTIDGASLKGTGELTIRAVTKEVPMDLQFEQLSGDSFKAMGEIPVTMTEYGVIPPTAMLGAIKTGDDVTIKFEMVMKK